MKAFQQYIPVVLFNILFKVILDFRSADEKHIEWKARELYDSVVLFVMLYKAVLTFQVCR